MIEGDGWVFIDVGWLGELGFNHHVEDGKSAETFRVYLNPFATQRVRRLVPLLCLSPLYYTLSNSSISLGVAVYVHTPRIARHLPQVQYIPYALFLPLRLLFSNKNKWAPP